MPHDTAINVRTTARIRALFTELAAANGMSQVQLFRHLVVAAAERQVQRENPELRVCVECGEIVSPGPDGHPDWHTHHGRVIGERKEI